MTTKRFERNGQPTIVYDDLGDPDAPPVILLHGGAAGTRHSWQDIPTHLARAYRVLVPDLRGHGDSDRAKGEYRIEHNAGDIEAFIEEVTDGTAALVGHSWGGLVAAQVAGTRPELVDRAFFEDAPLQWERVPRARGGRAFRREEFRTRVGALLDEGATPAELSATALEEWGETGDFFRPRQEVLLAQRDRGASVDELVAGIAETPSPLGGTVGDLMDEAALRLLVTGLLACDPELFDGGGDVLAAYDPERPMTCPVFMLRADPAFGPPPIGAGFPPEAEEAFLSTHPKATVEFVPGASHGIHAQMPDLFVGRLEAFLEDRHV